MAHYYDREGNKIGQATWCELFENGDYKRVALTEVGDKSISTVWLGLDHGVGVDGEPLIFETMVFADSWTEEACSRYSTETQAIVGHYNHVVLVAASFPTDEELQNAAKSAQAILNELEAK